ncbi:MAG TPA: TonB-dependent receptor, partial [Longimicrobiales bacterium]|nr:TonB-dependent receptor [Longimicrobiales bacterium]
MITRFIRSTLVLAALVAFAAPAAAQTGAIAGRVTADGQSLSAAQVSVVDVQSGATFGALSSADGRYTVSNLRPGLYNVTAQSIGYTTQTQTNVAVLAGQTIQLDFALTTQALSLSGLEVFASRAVDRKTPVAFTNVEKVQIQNQLASRDLPMVLNVTPSVYASQAGGGAGDARINVRGFSQRNTAVMINGVPVNDMENGWVYWSNWDGLGDASTSIQLQRGLSAVNLATPSIGGTLNVITDPTAQETGVSLKQEFGNDGFLKTTFTGSTGEIGKFAVTGVAVRKTGDGVIDGLYTDAWAYYLAASFQANARNRLEFFAVGAPQTHGQRLYALNAATYSHEFARSLDGYDLTATRVFRGDTLTSLERFPEAGIKWNPNWAPVNTSYRGKQYASVGPETGTFARQISNALHERENYFHKPQVNLNWYSY